MLRMPPIEVIGQAVKKGFLIHIPTETVAMTSRAAEVSEIAKILVLAAHHSHRHLRARAQRPHNALTQLLFHRRPTSTSTCTRALCYTNDKQHRDHLNQQPCLRIIVLRLSSNLHRLLNQPWQYCSNGVETKQ